MHTKYNGEIKLRVLKAVSQIEATCLRFRYDSTQTFIDGCRLYPDQYQSEDGNWAHL